MNRWRRNPNEPIGGLRCTIFSTYFRGAHTAHFSSRLVLCLVPAECHRLTGKRLVRVLMAPGENVGASSPSFPWEMAPPVGTPYGKARRRPAARARRPRPRICLRNGCGRRYQPRSWNQRYCQEPECRRQVHRWQAARRQAKHRQDADVKARHAQAERARRQRAKAAPQTVQGPGVTPERGHAAGPFFPSPYAIGPAATNPP